MDTHINTLHRTRSYHFSGRHQCPLNLSCYREPVMGEWVSNGWIWRGIKEDTFNMMSQDSGLFSYFLGHISSYLDCGLNLYRDRERKEHYKSDNSTEKERDNKEGVSRGRFGGGAWVWHLKKMPKKTARNQLHGPTRSHSQALPSTEHPQPPTCSKHTNTI